MVFYEGKQLKQSDFSLDCYNYMIESYNIQRDIRRSYTESAMTLHRARIDGVLNENTEADINIEVNDETLNKLIDILKKLGKFLNKLIGDFIIFIKTILFRDNAILLKANEDLYDSVPIDTLDNMKYSWREPSQKLLSFVNGDGNTESSDISLIWTTAFNYTSNADSDTPFADTTNTVMTKMTNSILKNGGVSNIVAFQKEYAKSLLAPVKFERGITYDRKILIKNSMISKKIIFKLEASLKEQQRSIERFIKELDKKRSDAKDIRSLDKCREAVTTLNNVAVAVSNVIIDSIKVYEGQCRSVFLKIVKYANAYKEN